jgi:D-sedoheptulose 7-phosphate isomerase
MTDAGAVDLARIRLGEAVEVAEAMRTGECAAQIAVAAEEVLDAMRGGGKLLLFGNGGSAADALHVAAEFVGRYMLERRPLPAIALVANPSAVTAIGNDYGFDEVFARQVRALGVPGDVAIGFTTSGRSPNVVLGLAAARELGMTTIAMTGAEPGPVGNAAQLRVSVPSGKTPRVQEGHMVAAHVICEWVEARLVAEAGADGA